ncbi:MAG TPA: SDR family NAD(P)-dependent oxidoreductase, partial [Thermomicrobiales bacterium]|nr:SDR family NAD(P)-dependent oxidoreductase [Thermomicrobiales bacterium]
STTDRFAGKRAIVTGASSGIGRATALRLAREGARVALIARRQERLDAIVAEIDPAGGAIALPADCADEASIAAAIDQAAAAFGGLDIVISNAGIELLGEDDRVDRLDLAVWRRLLRNNLDGQFLTCKHGIRHLLAGGGAVVCVGSNTGYLGMATNEPAYSASKGGVFAMMRVMAIDYAREGIRVNMVVPGFIDTPMNEPVMRDPDELRYWTNQIPIGRAGAAEECAAAILWLASAEASYCVGAALVVDGGQAAI